MWNWSLCLDLHFLLFLFLPCMSDIVGLVFWSMPYLYISITLKYKSCSDGAWKSVVSSHWTGAPGWPTWAQVKSHQRPGHVKAFTDCLDFDQTTRMDILDYSQATPVALVVAKGLYHGQTLHILGPHTYTLFRLCQMLLASSEIWVCSSWQGPPFMGCSAA